MTAMHLRWAFRPLTEVTTEVKAPPGRPLSGRIGDPLRVERSWLTGASGQGVLRGAFGLGSTRARQA